MFDIKGMYIRDFEWCSARHSLFGLSLLSIMRTSTNDLCKLQEIAIIPETAGGASCGVVQCEIPAYARGARKVFEFVCATCCCYTLNKNMVR